MPLSRVTVCNAMRDLMASVTGLEAVYSFAHDDEYRVPEGFSDFPMAIVIPGSTRSVKLGQGQHRHSYEMRVQILTGEADFGERMARVFAFEDLIINHFTNKIALGGTVNSCLFESTSGAASFDWGDESFPGIELTFSVSEDVPASPALTP